jgi:hypothetical protein
MQILVVLAERDTPLFRQHSFAFAHALCAAGHTRATVHDLPGLDHFDVIETLDTATSEITVLVLASLLGSWSSL